MLIRTIITLIILLLAASSGFAQKTKKYSPKQEQSSEALLERATQLQEKSPKEAIALLSQLIQRMGKSKRRDRNSESKAYLLLGSIYENIGQDELALQRYNQVLSLLNPKKQEEEIARVHLKIGRIYLRQKLNKLAEESFRLCIELSIKDSVKLQCEEGIADVILMRGQPAEGLSQIDYVADNFELDSLSNARLEARRSRAYVQQNDYPNATKSYYNSIQNLPNTVPLDKKDYEQIQKAQDDLLDYNELQNAEKIDIRTNTANLNVDKQQTSEVMVVENMKIAGLLEKENRISEAERFIEISKEIIDKDTKAASVADVYRKSYDINRKVGKMDAALGDLENYIQAKEQAIEQLQNDLAEQVEIVKQQQQIDLIQRDFALEEKDEELLTSQLQNQRIVIGLLSLLLLASLVFFYFLYKSVKAKRQANQLLLIKSLRTQMNPHFIFNALNSVNNFIAKNDEKAANKFLSEFSQLMRKVLDYSRQDFIAFEEEMELNELYLKLEHFRFRDKFDYQFDNALKRQGYDLEVPPMLIQPFIENAVWHGLRYKEGKGLLKVEVVQENKNILIRISDDGIGREKSKALKTSNQKKYKSTGLENVSRRLALINEIYQKQYEITVEDLRPGTKEPGTCVVIKIPMTTNE